MRSDGANHLWAEQARSNALVISPAGERAMRLHPSHLLFICFAAITVGGAAPWPNPRLKRSRRRAQADLCGSRGRRAHRLRAWCRLRHTRLVGMYPTPDFARSGGVIAYGRDITDPMRRMAYYIHQIITGAKPGDLPFEQPTRLHLVINLQTAPVPSISRSRPRCSLALTR